GTVDAPIDGDGAADGAGDPLAEADSLGPGELLGPGEPDAPGDALGSGTCWTSRRSSLLIRISKKPRPVFVTLASGCPRVTSSALTASAVTVASAKRIDHSVPPV